MTGPIPQQPTYVPPARPPRAKVGRKGWIVIICAGPAALVLVFGLVFLMSLVPKPAAPTPDDVKLTSCGLSSFGTPEAHISVKNNSGHPSGFVFIVAFTTADGARQLDTADAFVRDLAPGQSADATATSLTTDTNIPDDFHCKLIRSRRM